MWQTERICSQSKDWYQVPASSLLRGLEKETVMLWGESLLGLVGDQGEHQESFQRIQMDIS